MSAVEVLVYLSSDDKKVKRCVDNVLKYTPNACNVRFWGDHISNTSARYVNKFCTRTGPTSKRSITLTNAHKLVGYNSLMSQALREAKARYIAVLNDNTIVTEGWISKMMACLRSEASLGIVCPFTCIGVRQNLFSTLPSNVSLEEIVTKLNKTSKREYPRITSADVCILIKKEALDRVHFFQPNTCIEADLCHAIRRLGFNVAIADDVFVYCDKSYMAPLSKEDSAFYSSNPLGRFRQGMIQGELLDTNISSKPPRKYPTRKVSNKVIPKHSGAKIKIYSPSDADLKHGKWWGDHWVRENLYEAFEKWGWARSQEDKVDFSLLLKGERYVESKATNSAVWIYSHPDDDIKKFLSPKFDLVYTLSEKHADKLRSERSDVKMLLPATSKIYCPRENLPKYDILIVGNSSKPERIKAVKYLIGKGYNIKVVGLAWERFINKKYIMSPYWDNEKYSELFNQAKITVYVHHEDMSRLDFVAVRILDVIACSDCFIISDKNDGLAKLGLDIPQYKYGDLEGLGQLVEQYLNNPEVCANKMQEWRRHIVANHTFERRTEQILLDIAALPQVKKTQKGTTDTKAKQTLKVFVKPRIFVPFKLKTGKGGAHSFMATLVDEIEQSGRGDIVYNMKNCDVLLLVADLGKLTVESLEAIKRKKGSNIRICHRLDGSFHQHGLAAINARDNKVQQLNMLSDINIYQSTYGKNLLENSGITSKDKPNIIIYNGTNRNVFKPLKRRLSMPMHIVSANCSRIAIKRVERLNEFVNKNATISHIGHYASFVRLDPSIKVLSPVAARELNVLYEQACVFVHTGDNDTCPNAVIEAMSVGLPIIYWRSGGTPELVGEAGVAVDDFESIDEMLQHLISNYNDLHQMALYRAQQFDIHLIAQKYIEVFEKGVNNG